MKCLLLRRFGWLLVVVGVGLLPGCGKKLPPMFPVSGKVTVDGKPLTGGQVTLVPPDLKIPSGENSQPDQPSIGTSAGTIDSNGEYKIYTAGKEGAPLGKYKVTVTPTMMPSADPKKPPPSGFNQKFSNVRTTTLQIEVVESPAPGAYDLKLTK